MRIQTLRWAFFIVLAMVGMTIGRTCTAQQTSNSQEDALLAAARTAITRDANVFADFKKNEFNALSVAGASAERQKGRLILHLKSGQAKTYANSKECADPDKEGDCVQYVLIVHANSRGDFLVLTMYYESAEYRLVDDRTGRETVLAEFPIFSPKGDRVFVALDEMDEPEAMVQIWRRAEDRFVMEWSASPYKQEKNYTTYGLIRWNSEDVIDLKATIHYDPPKPDETRFFGVRRNKAGWHLAQTP
jgi:hypothetical protein